MFNLKRLKKKESSKIRDSSKIKQSSKQEVKLISFLRAGRKARPYAGRQHNRACDPLAIEIAYGRALRPALWKKQLDFLFRAVFYFWAVSYFWVLFFLELFQIEHPTASGSHVLLCWQTGRTARIRSGLTARSLKKQLDVLCWAVFYFWAFFFLELFQIEHPTASGSHALSCWRTGLAARMRSGLMARFLK